MKIGIVSPGGFDRSGRERVIPVFLWLIERLAARHKVHVYTLQQSPEPETYELHGATVHNIGDLGGQRRGADLIARTIRAISQEHRRGKFDILHGLWASGSGLSAVIAGRLLRVPTVVSVAGGELASFPEIDYGGQRRTKTRIETALCLKLVGTVTAASEVQCVRIRAVRPDVRKIVMGVDLAAFQPTQDVPDPEDRYRLAHVASLNRVKDQRTLLRAFAEILAAEPRAHLDIIGVDTLNGAIQKLAQELGLNDSVTFHGFQPSKFVADRLRQSHLLLHSSLSEMGPLVCLEAAACGVPTVGTDVGLIADLAPDAASAVPVGDSHSLAQAALALLHDDAARTAMGARAMKFARRYDADWTAAQFESLYLELSMCSRAAIADTSHAVAKQR